MEKFVIEGGIPLKGEVIPAGTPVKVLKVEGPRIVVEPIAARTINQG